MKRLFKIFLPVFICLFCFAAPVSGAAPEYVIDDAGILSNADTLSDRLESIGSRCGVDIVVVTTETTNGKSTQSYADDFYDYNNYSDDGILFLLTMDHNWAISTKGKAIKAFTDKRQSEIVSEMKQYLSDENFDSAFSVFADKCEDILNTQFGTVRYLKIAGIAVVSGLIIALIVAFALKGQLKSVKFQTNAGSYINRNSVKITQSRDMFLYKTLSKTKRESSSSSGGSSTHTSSSGSTHGGSSGKW